jgi:hypothetical protein
LADTKNREFTYNDVVPGTTYQFKVAATNELGESYLTAFVEALAATYPNPPVL